MQEIIGFQIDNKLYFGLKAIEVVKIRNTYQRLISRNMMKLMDCADLGPKWGELAKLPTLFYVDSTENPKEISWEQ